MPNLRHTLRRSVCTRSRKPVLAVVALLLGAGCGDNLAHLPAEIEVGDVRIETDPLVLHVRAPRGEFVSENFVEVAVATFFGEQRYYDPRDNEPGAFSWHVATRATRFDPESSTLVLDNGAELSVVEGPVPGSTTLVLDTARGPDAVLARLVLPRDPIEPIYGFGENFSSPEAGGSVREMQLRIDLDSESGLNEVHVPVPLSLWPARGVGVFVEDPRPAAFDVGAQRPDEVLATFTQATPGPLSAHVFTAADPLELVRTYIDMTAAPAVPPIWAFAPQQWRNEHKSSQEVLDDAQRMRAESIPGSVMWIDNPWQTAYNDFVIDETRFENADAMLDTVRSLGYRVVVWSTPYVNVDGPTADDFASATELGYLVQGPQGPFVFPWQDGPGAMVDFTAPGATEWWRERIERITSRGISGFKLDFGEELVPNFGGSLTPFELAGGTSNTLHNAYSAFYHEAYLGALPEGEGFLITRAGSYGEQAVNTCIWPGDLDSDFSIHGVDNGEGDINVGGLPAAVAGGLSLSVSGYPFYGSDIGGFRDGPTSTETLIRWAQYAALGTIMQLGGGGESHNPWDTTRFDPPALDVYREYARLHMDLIPYIYSLATVAGLDGTPVVRPTRFLYPNAASDDATFLLGDALFVAPVIEEGATSRDVVLPPGEWIDWWTGAAATGDGITEITVAAPLTTLPLWRRANAIVPMYAQAADTLVEVGEGTGVSTYLGSAGRALRLLWTSTGDRTQVSLYDSSSASAEQLGAQYVVNLTAGSSFDVFTLDIDGRTAPSAITLDSATLPDAGDETSLRACSAPGCFLHQGDRLQVRVHLSGQHIVRIAD